MENRRIIPGFSSDFDQLYHFAPIGLMTLNREGLILDYNLTAKELLGLSGEYNIPLANQMLDDSIQALELFLIAVFRDERLHEIHLPIFSPDGKRLVIQGYGHRRFGDPGQGIVALLPVEERLSSNEDVNRMAFYDQLTGLPNRSLFNERIQFELKSAHRNHMSFSVLFIDLDHFKYVNDTLGHEAGDKVLCEVSQTLSRCLRETDMIARLGGDEFAVILRETVEPKDVAIIANRILEKVARPILFDQVEVVIGCSIGIAIYPTDGQTKDMLLKSADMAMYKAKQEGRNLYVFYNQDLREKIFKRLDMESKLQSAFSENRLRVHYQPIYDIRTDVVIGIEALMRWEIEDRVWVTPKEFIPILEKLGLMVPYGGWVIEQACLFNKSLLDMGHQLTISVNVSFYQLIDPGFFEMICRILEQTGLPANRLEIEITEISLLHENYNFKELLNQLRQLGVQLTLDDFGTGYASLTYLYEVPLQRVKIDGAFITQCFDDESKQKLIQLIVRLGLELMINVTAEGVENENELVFLEQLGCQSVQGYYFAKPQPAHQIVKLLAGLEDL